jgi:hypothetical protein
MADGDPVTPRAVRSAAALADLDLTGERADRVAALLSAWVPAAQALSRRMQAEDLRDLVPVTVFTHGPSADPDEGSAG